MARLASTAVFGDANSLAVRVYVRRSLTSIVIRFAASIMPSMNSLALASECFPIPSLQQLAMQRNHAERLLQVVTCRVGKLPQVLVRPCQGFIRFDERVSAVLETSGKQAGVALLHESLTEDFEELAIQRQRDGAQRCLFDGYMPKPLVGKPKLSG